MKHNLRECNKCPFPGLYLVPRGVWLYRSWKDQLLKHKQLVVYWIWLLTELSRCKRINLKFSLETDIPLRRFSLFWTYPHLVETEAKTGKFMLWIQEAWEPQFDNTKEKSIQENPKYTYVSCGFCSALTEDFPFVIF